MSMLQHSTRAWGSPSRYIQGRYELENMKTHTEVYRFHSGPFPLPP